MNVFILALMTADGFIGRDKDHLATSWANPEDKELFKRHLQDSSAMVFGYNTFMTTARKYPSVFTKSMPNRRLLVYTHHKDEVEQYPKVEAVTKPPRELLALLEAEGIQDVALLGGVQVYTDFVKAGVVDDIYIDIQATLFGTGMTLFKEPLETQISLENVERLGDNNVLLHYKVLQND